MNVSDVLDDQRNVDLAGGCSGALRAEKRRDIHDAGDLYSLTFKDQGGQGAVEAAGKKS